MAVITFEAIPQASFPKAQHALRILTRVVMNLIVAAAVAVFLFLAVGPRIASYRTETMLTGSMAPYINPGDVVVVTPEAASSIRVGQVITFAAPLADHRIVSHRVVAVMRSRSGAVMIRTKGDANPLPDPWVAQIQGSTAWHVRAVVPHLGALIRVLQSRPIRVLSIWAIPGSLLLFVLARIWRRPKARVEA